MSQPTVSNGPSGLDDTTTRVPAPTSYIADPVPLIAKPPPCANLQMESNQIKWDPKKHLALAPPSSVTTLAFDGEQAFPYSEELKKKFPGCAFSAPFPVLSEEGVRDLRGILESHRPLAYSGPRAACKLRGEAFRQQFITDFTEDPDVMKLLSELAGTPLAVSSLRMNHGHTNFGQAGASRGVEEWHCDGVEFVLVVILSDITDMKGGELQVANMPKEKALEHFKANTLTGDRVLTAGYKQAGYGMFMCGSQILHRVTGVESAREPRISLVNSYQSRDVLGYPDCIKYHTFLNISLDPKPVLVTEYARHKAWRARSILDCLMNENEWIDDEQHFIELMRRAIFELEHGIKSFSDPEPAGGYVVPPRSVWLAQIQAKAQEGAADAAAAPEKQ